jgi:hypothetical protein
MPRCAVALRGRFQNGIVVAWQRNGMACVNQTRPHCVNQMGKTQSNPAGERHGMCELALMVWKRGITNIMLKNNITNIMLKRGITNIMLKHSITNIMLKNSITNIMLKRGITNIMLKRGITNIMLKHSITNIMLKHSIINIMLKRGITNIMLKHSIANAQCPFTPYNSVSGSTANLLRCVEKRTPACGLQMGFSVCGRNLKIYKISNNAYSPPVCDDV